MFSEVNLKDSQENYTRSHARLKLIPGVRSVSKDGSEIVLSRPFDGADPLFYYMDTDRLVIGDSCHEIAEHIGATLDQQACFRYLYFEYPHLPETLYSSVFEVGNDVSLHFRVQQGSWEMDAVDAFSLPDSEIEEPLNEIARELRSKIVSAVKKRLVGRPVVLLSGGLDSQVLAIVTAKDLGCRDVLAAHFTVKGHDEVEEPYARKVANQLGIELLVSEVDPQETVDMETIAASNAPYIGAIAQVPLMKEIAEVIGESKYVVFSGQDTRLHTPAIDRIDELALSSSRILDGFWKMGAGFGGLVASLIPRHFQTRKWSRMFTLLASRKSREKYACFRYFHLRRFDFNEKHSVFLSTTRDIEDAIRGESKSLRAFYNAIVKENWRRQYLFDIKHMQSVGRKGGGSVVLPFYDKSLNEYAARLPMSFLIQKSPGKSGFSNARKRVGKFALRKAFAEDLDEDLVYRDKAVMKTNYLFFNGGLRDEVRAFCADHEFGNSTMGRYLHIPDIQRIASQQSHWTSDDNFLLNLIFNAMVIRRLWQKFERRSSLANEAAESSVRIQIDETQ